MNRFLRQKLMCTRVFPDLIESQGIPARAKIRFKMLAG